YPSTEYLDLSFLDFISFNVYLHREEDFRRYFTHLIGQAGELPLLLSETGMDTIREGEEHQAELLAWQGKAAFELGLSGFIVFAFTDEWFTGGTEISDWAFGLTRRDRSPKPAFDTVASIFANNLPPKLTTAPKASVIVCAYNAASTLGECVASLRTLNYPNYETIVVDDGSTDSTAQIAEQAGVQTIRLEHRGLAAARNAGVDAASGEIIAFIDADARADRDWLYHLIETITRRDAAAASGPNFAPTPVSTRAAAMAVAPGLPREVRAGDADLAQLCGCNMALSKTALKKIGGFDPAFTTAGDDVDLSWRLTESGETLAYAPGAVVIHERRATLGSYLAQQRGYGRGEGLLAKRYPLRDAAEDGIYAAPSWVAALLGGARVYYGEFGRGLFQTVYSAGDAYGEVPMTIQWIAVSAVCLVLGAMNRFLGVIGGAGFTITILAAAARAASTPLPTSGSSFAARIYLWILNLLGPPIRSFARERIKWRIEARRGDQSEPVRLTPADSASVLAATREALIRRGLAVAETDGFQSYDLEIVVPPLVRIPINAVRVKDGRVSLLWRTRVAPRRALIATAIALLVMLAAGLPLRAACAALVVAAIGIAMFAFLRARRVSAIVEKCADEITNHHRISLAAATAGKA
ncbi:MAG TPA: glycosyltransferase, partial [Sporolactobacillaceae bacterium]|nr:glycosyltransferase [Sporolactobacillaceae bacterium]